MTQPVHDDGHTQDQWTWHQRAIKDAVRRFQAGELTATQKQRAITDENQRYYGDTAPPHLVRMPRRSDLTAVLADAAGVDEDVMQVALQARRDGGVQAYADVIATARPKEDR